MYKGFDLRRKKFGENVIPRKSPKTLIELIEESLEDVMLRILIVCGIFSLVLGMKLIRKRNYNSCSKWIRAGNH